MGAFRDLLTRGGRRPRWIDHTDYCGRLLAAGDIPFGDVARFIDWHRKAQGLLRPDVAALPLVPLLDFWLAGHGDLVSAMAGRRRLLYPLKVLLADEDLRGHIRALLEGLRLTYGGQPLAFVIPSPRAFILYAAGKAGFSGDDEVTLDDVDSAAMYMADFLRAFGDTGIDVLLLEEAPGVVAGDEELAACQAVLNIAGHYRWDVGLRLDDGAALAAVDFVIAPAGAAAGLQLPQAYWRGEAPAAEGGQFIYARIPPDAEPEAVLGRLAALA